MNPHAQTIRWFKAGLCSVFAFLPFSASAEDAPVAPPPVTPPAATDSKPASFKAPTAGLNTTEASVSPGEVSGVPTGTSHQDMLDRRDSLEGDMRYAKTKLDAARKRMEILQAVGKAEEADRLNGEVKDLEAKIKNTRDQLAQVEEELGKSSEGSDSAVQAGEEVILPGNNLEIFVNEDTSFNGRYEVRRGGYIILPQVGRVAVAGKTIGQAEQSVRKALQATQIKRATVMIERVEGPDTNPGPVILLSGEFKNPRPFRIPAGTAHTLVTVLLSSGGYTEKADLTRVKVMRMAGNRSVTETVNVKKILSGNADSTSDLTADLALSEGDVVVIPSGSLNLIYVTGKVKKAGSYRVGEGEKLTAYGAILQSGGFDHFADKKHVHILRAMPDGTKAKLPMNITDIEKGKRPDVVLQPNDIVVVPEKFWSW